MNISAPFIRRPVATTLLTVAIALAGAAAYTALPVAPLPEIQFPTIAITATLPGASAEVMASSVATPLERQLGQVAGITEMTSTSALGNTAITIQFELNRDIDGAARDVQAAINAARTYLPTNLPSNPTYRKVNPSDAPIMILGLTSAIYGPADLYDQASTVLAQRLAQIEGVGQVVVGGGALPSVRVDVDPTKLASFGLTLSDVHALLTQQNANLAKGQLSIGASTVDIMANDQISRAADYRPLVLATHAGTTVRLSDVAQVSDSVQNTRVAGYLDGARAIPIIVFRQPGANVIRTVDGIRAALPGLRASIPTGIETRIVLDRTTTIRASVIDVEKTLVVSIALVVLVVFAFLRNGRATFVPGVAVPVSLIGTLAVMYLLGFSIDNLSLMALTIATGFVVDDAIVVMENIARHLEAGVKPLAAAFQGAREIGFTVLSMSVSLIAVFIPILLMGGIVGRLFREFAVTLSTAIAVSMVVSLTATPMMCAYMLRPHSEERHGRLYQWSEQVFEGLRSVYRSTLHRVLARPAFTLAVLFSMVALNFVLIVKVPKGFFPLEDTGALVGAMRGAENASFRVMDRALRNAAATIKSDPAVDAVIGFTGASGATNTGTLFVALKPLDERNVSAVQVMGRLRPRLARVEDAMTFLQPVPDLRIGGRVSNATYQYTLQSDSAQTLVTWAPRLLREMERLPGFLDVSSDQQNGGLAERLTYDRRTAAELGMTVQALDAFLYDAFGQAPVSVIYTPSNQYYVVLEVDPKFQEGPGALDYFYVRGSGSGASSPALATTGGVAADKSIPIRTVSRAGATTTPLAVNHTGLFPSVTVSFNLSPGVSLEQATASIERAKAELMPPSSLRGVFSGNLLAYKQSLSTEPMLVATALAAVYIVLGILYESLIHPITIISTLPSATVGAMVALILFHEDLNIVSLIGLVLLIGIVKKNAIMMIDFALEAERGENKSSEDAIFEACMLRFRPILMTTLAAALGALPLALGTGMGHELRRPLGITIVGGLIVSQLLTLYTTPVVYLALDKLRLKSRRGAA